MSEASIRREPIVTPAFARTMAAYNAEMNRRFYAAVARLPDQERRRARGAFWGSIQGTLCHLLWADRMWMWRLDGREKPQTVLKDSHTLIEDFAKLHRARIDTDGHIASWAERLTENWLAEDQVWFSGAAGREMRMSRGLVVAHLFNHQAHHRGQAHAMITAAGESTGDTDLMLVA